MIKTLRRAGLALAYTYGYTLAIIGCIERAVGRLVDPERVERDWTVREGLRDES